MMFKKSVPQLHWWELTLLLGFAAALLLGLWLEREQSDLADSVLRLHVLANSDSEADQALKLKVRDRVLAEAEAILPDGTTLEEAERMLEENLPRLAAAGAEVVAREGYDYPVSASLEETWFPTKEYEDFSLPAGRYQALRVVIGEGEGQNWWCVVFPPLCLGSISESTQEIALESGLSEQQVSLLTGESEGYVVKFKALELWEKIKLAFS
ncbi:MAG: stage II sporulation protein R [Oscillospiraceae bacterium]